MFDIPSLINLFIFLIEMKNICENNPIKERAFLYLLTYLLTIKNIK